MARGYRWTGRSLMLVAVLAIAACSKQADKKDEAEQISTAMPEKPTVEDTAAAEARAASLSHGKALVETNCVSCHATEPGEASAHASAPSFATLFTNYPPEYIAEAFAEGVFVGHGDMPAFEFTRDQINDLVIYLKTLG